MDLKLPPLGEGVDSGSVVGILVKEGDQVAKGQGIIELETGKAVAPVPAPPAGKVTKILVAVGDKISVGQADTFAGRATAAAARQGRSPGRASAPSRPARARPRRQRQEEAEAETVAEEEEPPTRAGAGRFADHPPHGARIGHRLAANSRQRERRANRHGRRARLHPSACNGWPRKPRAAAPAAPAKAAAASKLISPNGGPIAKRPMTPLRKVIAQRMSESWNAVPRVTQFDEADITALERTCAKNTPTPTRKRARG